MENTKELDNPRVNFLLTKALFVAINQLKRIDELEQTNDASDMQLILDTKLKHFEYSGNIIEKIDETYKAQ